MALSEQHERELREFLADHAKEAAAIARRHPLIPSIEGILGQPLSEEGKAEVERILLNGIEAASQTLQHGLDAYKAAMHYAMMAYNREIHDRMSERGVDLSSLEGR